MNLLFQCMVPCHECLCFSFPARLAMQLILSGLDDSKFQDGLSGNRVKYVGNIQILEAVFAKGGIQRIGVHHFAIDSCFCRTCLGFLAWLEGWLLVSRMRVLFQDRHVSRVLLRDGYDVVFNQCLGGGRGACAVERQRVIGGATGATSYAQGSGTGSCSGIIHIGTWSGGNRCQANECNIRAAINGIGWTSLQRWFDAGATNVFRIRMIVSNTKATAADTAGATKLFKIVVVAHRMAFLVLVEWSGVIELPRRWRNGRFRRPVDQCWHDALGRCGCVMVFLVWHGHGSCCCSSRIGR